MRYAVKVAKDGVGDGYIHTTQTVALHCWRESPMGFADKSAADRVASSSYADAWRARGFVVSVVEVDEP